MTTTTYPNGSHTPTPSIWVKIGVIALVANALIIGLAVTELQKANSFANEYRAKFDVAADAAQMVVSMGSTASMLFKGHIPRLAAALIQSDFGEAATNLSAVADKIHLSTCNSGHSTLQEIASYASLVKSVSTTFKGLKKVPPPAGAPTPEGGLLLNPLKHITQFLSNQTNITDWGSAGSSCLSLVAELETLSWSGAYPGSKCVTGVPSTWSIYSSAANVLNTARNICQSLANLPDVLRESSDKKLLRLLQ